MPFEGGFGHGLGGTLEALAAPGGAFGVTLGSFWDQFGSVWVSVGDFGSVDGRFAKIFESIWVYEGAFSKNTHFPRRFLMNLYSSGVNCGSVWVTFGSLLVDEGDFGATLGSLRHHFWHVKTTLGSLWNHFLHMMVTSWQLWGHFVVTIGV